MDKKIILKPQSFWKIILKNIKIYYTRFQNFLTKRMPTKFLKYPVTLFAILIIPIICMYVLLQQITPIFMKRRAKTMVELLWDIMPEDLKRGETSDHEVTSGEVVSGEAIGGGILDLGSGDGYIADLLIQKGVSVTKIDVEDYNQLGDKVTVYDGKTLPYEDNYFEGVLINFILHHTEDPLVILREALRVSKKYIIVSEDIVDTPVDKFLGWLHAITYEGWNYHNTFHTSGEWEKIFEGLDLKIVNTRDISRLTWCMYPIKRRIYVLSLNR